MLTQKKQKHLQTICLSDMQNNVTLLIRELRRWDNDLLADGYYVGRKTYSSHCETRYYHHQHTRWRLTMYVHFNVGCLTLYEGKKLLKKYEV